MFKLDWFSASLFQDENHYETDREAIRAAWNVLQDRVGEEAAIWLAQLDWVPGPGRKPYSTSFRTEDGGIAVFAHAKLPHFLVEFSGRGCERLLNSPVGEDILEALRDRATRIDLAVDIECGTDPREFAAQRVPGRFKSGSEVVSESGTTVYIGSKTSNRYARVYRYNLPHPRHALLRVEHVFRAEEAKTAVAFLLDRGYEPMAAECARMFGWLHPVWTVQAALEAEFKAHRNERGDAKTIYWLYETVAPVLIRLHNEGKLDFGLWFREAIAPKLSTPDDNGDDTDPEPVL